MTAHASSLVRPCRLQRREEPRGNRGGDIAAIARAGITFGCNPPLNDRFCPDDAVTRGEMATLLMRSVEPEPVSAPAPLTLDIRGGDTIGFVVETSCTYEQPIAFPDRVTAGIRVARIGTSSVRYEIGIFRNEDDESSAHGHFVHVYVERETRKATALPPEMRAALGKILVSE